MRKRKKETKGLFDDFRNAYKVKKKEVVNKASSFHAPSTDVHGLPVAKTKRGHTRWYWR